jgi:hypothetical protein
MKQHFFRSLGASLAFGLVCIALQVACGSNPSSPSALPSPSPSPSASPAPQVEVALSVDVIDANSRQLIFTADHGQEVVLRASTSAFDAVTHEAVPVSRFVREYSWANLSDPMVGCGLFGPVTTDHPHASCFGDGYFIVRVTAIGYDGEKVGESPIYSLPIGSAATSNSAGWRRLSAAEAARFGG